MEKIIIYTNEVCPYCKQIKEELTKNEIKFENKFTKDFIEEWDGVVGLTGSAQVPTIFYKDNYFQPQRDFGNPQGLISLLKNFNKSEFSESRQVLERIKTLNTNMIMAFNRMDNILRQIETKLNTEKDEHESTS